MRASRARRRKPSRTLQDDVRDLSVQLEQVQHQHAAAEQQCGAAQLREQVLVDLILQFQEILHHHQRLEAAAEEGGAAAAPADAPGGAGAVRHSSYTSDLLRRAQPAHLEAVLQWGTVEHCQCARGSFTQLLVLLELAEREQPAPDPARNPAATVDRRAAMQQLEAAVDAYALRTVLVCAHSHAAIPRVRHALSLNLLTNEPAVPPPQHWQAVVRRLQLNAAQAQLLGAAYREFVRMRSAMRAAAQRATDSWPDSCGVQLLLVSMQRASGDGGGSGAATGQRAASGGRARTSSSSSSSGAPLCGTTAADASASGAGRSDAGRSGAGSGSGGSSPDVLQLLRPLRTALAGVSLQLFCYNTLTKRQLALMVVASFPFFPSVSSICEALINMRPDAVAADDDAPDSDCCRQAAQHAAQRRAIMQAQAAAWWAERTAAESQLAGEAAEALTALRCGADVVAPAM